MANTMIKKYIHSKVNDSFELSVDDVAKNVGGYGRFKYWLNGNQSKIKEVLNAVKDAGVSPAYFASYEAGEGYNSSWGWLNHTTPQGDPVQDAIATANWIVKQSKDMNGEPAWIDYANYVDFVPADVKAEGNADFKSLPSGTIGRVTVAGTAAATWEVYYPKGLSASYNKVQDYGKPLTDQYKKIIAWGGKIDGKGGSDDDDDGSSSGNDNGGNDNGSGSVGDSIVDVLKSAMTDLIEKIEDAMNWHLHSIGTDKYFSNALFTLEKTFNNTYKISMGQKLLDDMKDLINSVDTGSNGGNGDNPKDDEDDKPDPPSGGSGKGESVPPNGKNASVIGGNWEYNQLPTKYKESIKIPLFDTSYLTNSGNVFPQFGYKGECTELTQCYMTQLWGKVQPADDGQITNGYRVWEVYKAKGAKTTHSPTVGYGFSSKPPYVQAFIPGIGHTGVVVAVYDDGSFLVANYNVPPNYAPSRTLYYTLINGVPKNAGSNIVFFSGIA